MNSPTPASPVSKLTQRISYVLSAIPVLLLVFSAGLKLGKPPAVVEGFAHAGWPVASILGLGLLELACTALYLIPRTAVLGAILLTGYLGGAIATNLRIGEPGIVELGLGLLVWGGLYLREPRLRALLPVRR